MSKGQAEAHQGLGNCQEKVLNIFPAMQELETAFQKAAEDDGDIKLKKKILEDLVRVYQIVAEQFQAQNDYDKAKDFFQKCLEAAK